MFFLRLTQQGEKVSTAYSGKEALKILENARKQKDEQEERIRQNEVRLLVRKSGDV